MILNICESTKIFIIFNRFVMLALFQMIALIFLLFKFDADRVSSFYINIIESKFDCTLDYKYWKIFSFERPNVILKNMLKENYKFHNLPFHIQPRGLYNHSKITDLSNDVSSIYTFSGHFNKSKIYDNFDTFCCPFNFEFIFDCFL